jgi:hypothetical protein
MCYLHSKWDFTNVSKGFLGGKIFQVGPVQSHIFIRGEQEDQNLDWSNVRKDHELRNVGCFYKIRRQGTGFLTKEPWKEQC